jgi:AraC-like DNA-binding protein
MISVDQFQQEDDLFVIEAEKYLIKNIKNSVTIEQVAEKVGVSKRKLQQKFKDHFGISIQTYLTRKRMERAAILLEGTSHPIKVIANDCGYGTINSFIKTFRKVNKTSPAQWRKQIKS